MQEIIKSYPSSLLSGSRRLNITSNPGDVFGLRFALHTRIFIFSDAHANLHIDLIKQVMLTGCMYVLPPLHCYYFEPLDTGSFVIIDVGHNILKYRHRQLLYSIIYCKQKSLAALSARGHTLVATGIQ